MESLPRPAVLAPFEQHWQTVLDAQPDSYRALPDSIEPEFRRVFVVPASSISRFMDAAMTCSRESAESHGAPGAVFRERQVVRGKNTVSLQCFVLHRPIVRAGHGSRPSCGQSMRTDRRHCARLGRLSISTRPKSPDCNNRLRPSRRTPSFAHHAANVCG